VRLIAYAFGYSLNDDSNAVVKPIQN
jgi:hypothetical protein